MSEEIRFKNEVDKLMESIEYNTKEHWQEYYKDVPLDCILDDIVIDINEIKRLTQENKELKEIYTKTISRLKKTENLELAEYFEAQLHPSIAWKPMEETN